MYPCWLKSCFPPCILVVPKLPPHGFNYTHSSLRADAKAGIFIPGKKLQGQGAGAKEGFAKSAVPDSVTSGFWRHWPLSQSPPLGGTCNLTPPQGTIFGETTHPCAYPGLTPLPVPDPNNWRQCQGKTSPLANPTLVVKEIMFQSQVVLIFSKFLIFPRSEDWKLETNECTANSHYCSLQPWQ